MPGDVVVLGEQTESGGRAAEVSAGGRVSAWKDRLAKQRSVLVISQRADQLGHAAGLSLTAATSRPPQAEITVSAGRKETCSLSVGQNCLQTDEAIAPSMIMQCFI